MSCSKIIESFYNDDDQNSIIDYLRINIHAFFCTSCAKEIERYEDSRAVMREDFFPAAPGLENSIMNRIAAEENELTETAASNAGVLSTRGWVIAGVVLMISLVTAFFGMDFQNLASESGMSFLLPMGITIGIALTIYGAVFIGTHLKELSERFGL